MDKLTLRLILILLVAGSLGGHARAAGPQSRKVALVLSGGGARGAAHIGILKVFEREKIPIHCITGTSFGSLVGGLYSAGYSADDIERILSHQDWDNMLSDAPERRLTPLIERRNSRYQAQVSFRGWTPELPTGLREGQRLTEELDQLTTLRMLRAGYDFDQLPIQFRAVATNLLDGSAYVFSRGSLTEALRASMAIPLLFTPVEKDGMLLVDGGLANNLPTDVARSLGADVVIAVDVTSPLLKKEEIRNFLNVVDQSISLQMERSERENRRLADIVLEPGLDEFDGDDYENIPQIVKRGEEEAERQLEKIRLLVAGIPPRIEPEAAQAASRAVIDSVVFRGLKKVSPAQMEPNVQVRPGDRVSPAAIGADINRLYATRLFDRAGYTLEPVGDNLYRLVYILKESPLKAVGLGVRYDNDYDFIMIAEFTARQLFGSPSTAILSSQFGGLGNHFAALRLVPSPARFIFVEPRGEVLRLERLDIRNEEKVDSYIDRREGGQLMIGGTIFRQLEVAGGVRAERVRIEGGSEPNRLVGADSLVGPSFRLTNDTLDYRDFPRSGMALRLQVEKRSQAMGSDLDYSRWEADYQRYFSSGKNTLRINARLGYSRGPVPFYDRFFVGGYSFLQVASRQFVGLERDEFNVNQMAIMGASYRRRIMSGTLGLIRRGYVTGIYNSLFWSTQESRPFNFDLLHGAGIGVAFDTILGPLRATAGWAEGGRVNFYFSFGPSF